MFYSFHRPRNSYSLMYVLLSGFSETPVLKDYITSSKRFIHVQNIYINVFGNREGKPDDHSGGVSTERLVDKISPLREPHDFRITCVHLFVGTPHTYICTFTFYRSRFVREYPVSCRWEPQN
jgi:hypothetical protein